MCCMRILSEDVRNSTCHIFGVHYVDFCFCFLFNLKLETEGESSNFPLSSNVQRNSDRVRFFLEENVCLSTFELSYSLA